MRSGILPTRAIKTFLLKIFTQKKVGTPTSAQIKISGGQGAKNLNLILLVLPVLANRTIIRTKSCCLPEPLPSRGAETSRWKGGTTNAARSNLRRRGRMKIEERF